MFLMSQEGGGLGQECQASSELTVHFWASEGGHRGARVQREGDRARSYYHRHKDACTRAHCS